MISLRIASDFHLEFYDYKQLIFSKDRDINDYVVLPKFGNEKKQILLLAGDILTIISRHRYNLFFNSLSSRFKKVYVIAGNHEFYKYNFSNGYSVLREYYAQWKNIHFLQNDVIELNKNTALFGATLWTNFANSSITHMNYARNNMSDFKIISYGKEDDSLNPVTHFQPEHSVIEFQKSFKELNDFMKTGYKNKIVMSHHAPSFLSSHPRFAGSLLNPAFCTNLDDYITETDCKLWIHGHCHNNSDYFVGKTNVICNPFGYYNENKEYLPELIIRY